MQYEKRETENWETWLSYLSMDHFVQWNILQGRREGEGGKGGKLPRAPQCRRGPAISQNDFSVAIYGE